MKKDVVAGLGEIGSPIYKLLSRNQDVVGYDKDPALMNQTKSKKSKHVGTNIFSNHIDVSSLKYESFEFDL